MHISRPVRDPGRIEQAIECLRHARRLLRKAGCKRAAMRVRGALRSAEGAFQQASATRPRPLLITEVMGLETQWATEAAERLRQVGAS